MPKSQLALSPVARDAQAIWMAGVEAVQPSRLLRDKLRIDGTSLWLEDRVVDLDKTRRLVVVGAGKAAGTLAVEFERQICVPLKHARPDLDIRGWVNCPQGSFDPSHLPQHIHVHAARPAGINEPTPEAVVGTTRILELVSQCNQQDVVICLLSGGGSALLTLPVPGITLLDKQQVARSLSAAGANIEQLNCVRRALSQVKGGGLARACRAGRLETLIISDVLGDHLPTIASGPTDIDATADPAAALTILRQLDVMDAPELAAVVTYLQNARRPSATSSSCDIQHLILGNNADAVDAAGVKAVELGYRYVMECATGPEPDVSQVAEGAVQASLQLLRQRDVDCWISGGEPTVSLPSAAQAGRGGRNQHLALAVLHGLVQAGWPDASPSLARRQLAFLSGGTDGEDGPTTAAGAWFDAAIWQRAQALGLDCQTFLDRADSFHFFQSLHSLLTTGPTGTNVCDLRVAVASVEN